MPNVVAYIAIIIWPLVAIAIYKKFTLEKAVVWGFLLPFMFLPSAFDIDLPVIPALNKVTVPSMVAFLAVWMIRKKEFRFFPKLDFMRRILFLLVLAPVFTYITNGDQLIYGDTVIPGLGFMDLAQMVFLNVTWYFVPFMVGYQVLNTSESHKTVLKVLVMAGMIYILPILFELRMSPILHTWIYGFFPHQFIQAVRGSGYRPMVFMGHGLLVAFFMCSVLVAATTLWRHRNKEENTDKDNGPLTVMGFGLLLVLCKSMGALIYAMALVPLMKFFGPKMQMRVAMIFMAIVIIFPILRSEQILPTEKIVAFFEDVNEDRAQSLKYRFDNENILLEKANLRKVFGWGIWGRNRVYNPYTGKDMSTTDGSWIIALGKFGWFGYIAIFGMLCYPIYFLAKRRKKAKEGDISPYTICLSLLLAINLIDLLPNSSYTLWTALIAGAVYARAEALKIKEKEEAA